MGFIMISTTNYNMSQLIIIDDLIINVNSIKHITPTAIYYEPFIESDQCNAEKRTNKHVAYYKKTRVKDYDSADDMKSESASTNMTKHKWSWITYEITPEQFRKIKDFLQNNDGKDKGWLN